MTSYLNHAGTSWPKPGSVSVAVQKSMGESPDRWPRQFDEAHQAVAEFFGVQNREQLLLTPGCTSALSIAISDVFLAKGARLLTSQWEHHALHRPLLKRESAGVRLERIPAVLVDSGTKSRIKAPLDLDWLEQTLSKGDVGLIAMTAACNVTGELLPYPEVIRLAQRHDTMVLLDAAQVVGWLRLDLSMLGADLVAFGGHKGLQAPWGIGGLYLSDRARMECISATCELAGSASSASDQRPRPGYCDVGSVDQFALAGLHASIGELRNRNLDSDLAVAQNQIRRVREVLRRWDGVRLFGPEDPAEAMPTVAFGISGRPSGEIALRLREHGVIVGSGHQCAPLVHETLGTQANGLVRLSVGMGQPDGEVDHALDRLHAVCNALS